MRQLCFFQALGILFYWISLNKTQAQGCSDAGICSVQGYETNADHQDSLRPSIGLLRLSTGYALGERFTHQFFFQPELVLSIWRQTNIILRMPYQLNAGTLGQVHGLGDPVVLLSHQVSVNSDWAVSAIAGIRIPSSRASHDSLPMPYQTSLGTLDGLISIEVRYKSWRLRSGYQRVLKHQNENQYLAPSAGVPEREIYFSSRNLQRGNDFMIRADFTRSYSNWRFTPGALMVWRLRPDQFLSGQNILIEYPKSAGPTFNLLLQATIPLRNKWSLEPLLAAPVYARAERPDGLTRNVVSSLSLIRQL